MPQRSFADLTPSLPRSHVVVGKVERVSRLQASDEAVTNLIVALGCRGDWATRQILDGKGLLYCVFTCREDADDLAAAVQATDVECPPGVASQREFRLDERGRRSITEALRALAR